MSGDEVVGDVQKHKDAGFYCYRVQSRIDGTDEFDDGFIVEVIYDVESSTWKLGSIKPVVRK